jgi:hypothetical protein
MMMETKRAADQIGNIGAWVLGASLIGFAWHELVLRPLAGFPSDDMSVIIAGANTLRVGHLLKFGYAVGVALLTVGLYGRLRDASPGLAQLAAVAGIASVPLFIASGFVGLGTLQVVEELFPVNPAEARTTVLMRTVTGALLVGGTFAVGWFGLLAGLAGARSRRLPATLSYAAMLLGVLFILDYVLPDPVNLAAPLLTIAWAIGLGIWLWRNSSIKPEAQIRPSESRSLSQWARRCPANGRGLSVPRTLSGAKRGAHYSPGAKQSGGRRMRTSPQPEMHPTSSRQFHRILIRSIIRPST